jgi:ABC-type amino acid transport/signal transduction systems, periplasmic component/domain
MLKFNKFTAIALIFVTVAALASGCSSAAANTVFSADDLPGKTIGVQLGTTGDIYASAYETPETESGSTETAAAASTIERYKTGAEAIQALKQGKVDCVIIDNEPAKAFVEKNSDLKILDDPFALEEYAICISKDNSELKDKINAALAELKTDGTIDSIIKNYIGDDTKGKTPYTSPADVDRSNGTLTMATNAQFEPYEYIEGGKVIGIDADLAQAIADKLGMELVINDIDFDAIISAVQSGKADIGVAGMTITEDRLKSIDFTDSYTTATQVIVVRTK